MIGTIATVVGGAVAGAVLHEATHAVAAKLAGATSVRLYLADLAVEYRMPAGEPTWKDRLVNLAPQLVGVGALLGALVVGYRPSGVSGVAVVLGWAVYTLLGGVEDYSLAAAHGEQRPLSSAREWWTGLGSTGREAAMAIGLSVVSMALWVSGFQVGGRLGATLLALSNAGFLAAAVVAVLAVVSIERTHAARGRL